MSGIAGKSGPPGNTNAQKTGLWLKAASGLRLRSQKVRRLAERGRRAMPWLATSDMPTLRGWCELEILCASCFAHLMADGPWRGDGDPKRLLTEYRQLRQAQLQYATALGMTPASRTQLGLATTKTETLETYLARRYRPQDAPQIEAGSRAVPAGDDATRAESVPPVNRADEGGQS